MAFRVELEFRRAAARLIPPDSAVVVAVSGGADSVALLHLLLRLGRGRPRLAVAHLDHGLRRGSKADRRFVERVANDLGLECLSDRREVEKARRKDESLEEAARRVRRAFLIEAATSVEAAWIAMGHTMDDQAETILMRLVRGAGATALTGMAEAGPGPFVRPLLGLERGAVRDYVERRRLDFREDPTNRDLRFDRNRVRHRILPFLNENLNARAARHLVGAANRWREDAIYLDEVARRRLGKLVLGHRQGRLALDPAGLSSTPRPVAARVARLAMQAAGVDARRIAARHVEALLDLASGGSGRRVDLPGRFRARRGRKTLYIERKV